MSVWRRKNSLWLVLFLFILAGCLSSSAEDPRLSSSFGTGFSDVNEGSPVFFPLTEREIISEVTQSIHQAETEIAILAAIPEDDRNESNTIRRLDEILTRLDIRLCKYPVLMRMYQEKDLAEASRQAAARRSAFLHEIATRSDLFRAVRDTIPESDLGEEIRKQELVFFKQGGAGLPAGKKALLLQKYNELEEFRGRYLNNSHNNGPISVNLQLLQASAGVRNDIATILGYRNWFDLTSESGHQDWSTETIASFLATISNDTEREVKPVLEDLLRIKQQTQPNASILYDYEVIPLLNQEYKNPGEENRLQTRYLARTTVQRTFQVFTCLLDIRIEEVPGARVYDPNVSVYRISDLDTGLTLGWLYLDLREEGTGNPGWMTATLSKGGSPDNREKIAPAFLVSGSVSVHDGERWFTPEELRLFFHELGHFFTGIFSLSQDTDTGSHMPAEMTEMPSLLFEYLLQAPEMIQIISSSGYSSLHPVPYSPGKGITKGYPPDSAMQTWNRALQVIISQLDFRIATSSGDIRFEEWYTGYYLNMTGIEPPDGGGYLLVSPHLIDESAGSYWQYLAGDLAARVLSDHLRMNGILNKTAWKELKEMILSPGNQSLSSGQRIELLTGIGGYQVPGMRKKQDNNRDTPLHEYMLPGCLGSLE